MRAWGPGAPLATIAILCPAVAGHLNPHNSLGRALAARGHRVLHINFEDARARVTAAGLELRVMGQDAFPFGAVPARMQILGGLTGIAQLRYTLRLAAEQGEMIFSELLPILREEGVQLALIDEAQAGSASACEVLGIPWITVAAALSWVPEPSLPPPFTPWGPPRGALGRLRNRLAWGLVDALLWWPLGRMKSFRAAHGLSPVRSVWDERSPWLHLHMLPEVLRFPASADPLRVHLGPLVDPAARAPLDFDWQRLDGRPLVYVSLGTLQNRVAETFRRIAEATADLDCQVLISLGGGSSPEELGPLPGDPWVVGFAPQLEVLRRCALFVSHAGMNSALESASAGVPMVMLPVGNDQPGVAARIHHAGAGISLGTSAASVGAIRQAVQAVLREPAYGRRAQELATSIAALRPLDHGVALVEDLLAGRLPGPPLPSPQVPERMASSTQPAEDSGKASQ